MKKYTKTEIQDFKDYLDFNFLQGTFKKKFVQSIVTRKAWHEVEKMMKETDELMGALNQ